MSDAARMKTDLGIWLKRRMEQVAQDFVDRAQTGGLSAGDAAGILATVLLEAATGFIARNSTVPDSVLAETVVKLVEMERKEQ